MHQVHDDVAAEQGAALFGEPGEERLRQRLHAGDGGDAEHQAGEEDAKAGQPRAHLAPRQSKGEEQSVHAVRASDTMRPSLRRTMRWQRFASASSCGIQRRQRRSPAHRGQSEGTVSDHLRAGWRRAEIAGRGSSAKSTAGSGAMARASETRCCSPPDNCTG